MFVWLYKKIEGYSPTYNKKDVTSIVSIILFDFALILAHLVFVVVFHFLNMPEMKFVNSTCILLVIISIYIALYRYQFLLTCVLIILQLCYYSIACTYVMGYHKVGIMLYPVMIFAIYALFPFERKVLKNISMMVLVSFVITLLLRFFHTAKYENDVEIMEYVNIFFGVASIFFIINVEAIALKFINSFGNIENNILSIEAYQDFLTGAWNRRYMEQEFKRFSSMDHAVLVLADIDFFKKINDTYGHNTGDYVLTEICNIFRDNLRDTDIICRWGGEEFLFYIRNTQEHYIVDSMNRLKDKIEHTKFCYGEHKFNITVSFGIADVKLGIPIQENIDHADKALYFCKNNGRNQVATYGTIQKASLC